MTQCNAHEYRDDAHRRAVKPDASRGQGLIHMCACRQLGGNLTHLQVQFSNWAPILCTFALFW